MNEREKVIWFLQRVSRRLTSAAAMDAAAAGAIAGSAIAAAILLTGFFFAPSSTLRWWPVTPAIFALAAAGSRMLKGTGPVRAGIFLDLKFGLHEVFSMAAELASGNCVTETAMCIYQHAIDQMSELPEKIGYHRRGRKTVALLVLSLMFCTVLYLGAGKPEKTGRTGDELLAEIRRMSAKGREKLSERLKKISARRPAAEREVIETFAEKISALPEYSNESEIRKLLEELARGNIRLVEIVLEQKEGAGGKPADRLTEDNLDHEKYHAAETGGFGQQAAVPVYNPRYAKYKSMKGNEAEPGLKTPPVTDGGSSWNAAKAEADNAIRFGNLPEEYREILRNFFSRKNNGVSGNSSATEK